MRDGRREEWGSKGYTGRRVGVRDFEVLLSPRFRVLGQAYSRLACTTEMRHGYGKPSGIGV